MVQAKFFIASTILVLTTIALILTTAGLLVGPVLGSRVASSVNIGVYKDSATTINCTSINWGTLSPGSTATQIVYIKNTGNTAETLSMTTSNWTPSIANTILTLTWDKEGSTLQKGSVVPARLTVSIAKNSGSLTSFNCNIIISAPASRQK